MRHVVEHMADVCSVVQTLDAPVPQMVDTVLEFFRALDQPVDEQVIAVPKIFTDRVSEQLVEVPTVVSFSSFLQRTVEQTVDKASRGSGRRGGLQGFSQDRVQQRLPLTFQFLVAIFKVSSLAKVQQPLLLTFLMLQMRLV